MGEGYLAEFGRSPWGPMAFAFLFGVAFGWVIWGARSDRNGDAADLDTAEGAIAVPKEIVVIKAELNSARSLLDQRDAQEEALGEQLSALDETVKRANGRLKTILAAVKRAANR